MGRKRTAGIVVGLVLALGGCGGTSARSAADHAPVRTVATAVVMPAKRVHVVHCKCAWYDHQLARRANSHKAPTRDP